MNTEIPKGYKKTKVGVIPEDWGVVKIKDVLEKSFYGTSNSTSESGKYPVLRMGNMNDGKLFFKDLVFIDLEEKEFEKFKLESGDILLNRTNSYELVGKISLFEKEENFLTASYIVTLRPNKDLLNSFFVNALLNSYYFQHKIKALATKGVSQANINPTSFRNTILIPLPPLKEQEKIGKILTAWDRKIELIEKLLKAKENLKKGLSQKLLSGDKRFKEFNQKWEEKRFFEIFTIFNGYAFSSLDSQKNGTKWVKIADVGFSHMKRENISYLPNDFEKKYSRFLLFKNDIVVALTRPILNNKLKIAIIDDFFDKSLLNQRVGKITSQHNLDFIYHLLQQNRIVNKIDTFILGTEPPNLSMNEIKNIIEKIPPLKEQKKISTVLSLADKEISLTKQKLETLKKQKKALMQKLLTGKVRVKV